MNELKAFKTTPASEQIKISADIFRISPSDWLIEFSIHGNLKSIIWPDEDEILDQRKDLLWQHTCLEAFFATSQNPHSPYWELNCSPAGSWNLYHLSSYRQNLTPWSSGQVQLKSRTISATEARFVVSVTNLNPGDHIFVGLTAVIKHSNGELSYWAISHPPDRADFHNKSNFSLEIK